MKIRRKLVQLFKRRLTNKENRLKERRCPVLAEADAVPTEDAEGVDGHNVHTREDLAGEQHDEEGHRKQKGAVLDHCSQKSFAKMKKRTLWKSSKNVMAIFVIK